MNIDPLADELFLRLVLEQQPGAAKPGKKRAIWLDIAHTVNETSGRVVFRTAETAIQRRKFLLAVLDNVDHAFHGELTREMHDMLRQIRGDEPPEVPTRRIRTRSQAHASGDDTTSTEPPMKKRTGTKRGGGGDGVGDTNGRPVEATTHSPGGSLVATPPPTSLGPYELIPPAVRHASLDHYLGAQAERDRHACYEREQLRRELMDSKRDTASLEREVALLQNGAVRRMPHGPVQGDAMATTAVVHTMEELAATQRLALDEMKSERASLREQVAAMVALLQQALHRDGSGEKNARGRGGGEDDAFGDGPADRSTI